MAYYPHVRLLNKYCNHLKKEAQISEWVSIWHQVISSPVPLVSNRDVSLMVLNRRIDKEKYQVFHMSVEHPAVPLVKKNVWADY